MNFPNNDLGDRNEENESGFDNLCTCGCGQHSFIYNRLLNFSSA